MPNRLAQETSPYLLQHQNNPVDWFPWGEEAFAKAAAEEKPVFLSVGYSACHWCHVMEHESFESEEIAAILNRDFVSIKVDREERPDIDQIYMNAVQMLTQHGGWPMSVFLTPDGKPYYAGTYWPPSPRSGMPGFGQVLTAVREAWDNRREQVLNQADQITGYLDQLDFGESSLTEVDLPLLQHAADSMQRKFDGEHGGFGGAPKFPHSMGLQFLLRMWYRTGNVQQLEMATFTLEKMAAGGIYDHLGGGFARYSVDAEWLVPHFEKMLYDNALLADAYIDGFLATGRGDFEQTTRETLDYILRDMTDPNGPFYSTEDADSEGEEGKFYVWKREEIFAVLADMDLAEKFCEVYGVTNSGNFEGNNILFLPRSIEATAEQKNWDLAELHPQLASCREKLYQHREKRIHPGKDDKVLVSWNGMMIHTLARAGAAFGETKYTEAASKAANFILQNLRDENGRLLHAYRHGQARFMGMLDDYTFMANALVSLYETTQQEAWLTEAVKLMDEVIERFVDPAGGFFFTASDHEQLVARAKDLQDSSVPSGNSMAATVLLRLAALTGKESYREHAAGVFKQALPLMEKAPQAVGQMLCAADMAEGPFYEIVIAGESSPAQQAMIRNVEQTFIPNRVLAVRDETSNPNRCELLDPLFEGRGLSGEATLYICEGFTCQRPVQGDEATAAIQQLGKKS